MRNQLYGALLILALFAAGCKETRSAPSGAGTTSVLKTNAVEDPFLWLEDVTGDKALDWVRQQNAVAMRELEARPDFQVTRQRLLAIYNSRDRIPFVGKNGRYYYNFWRDEKNPRGLWRRTTMEEYRKPEPQWEIILDVDQLAKDEKENWIWEGADFLEPDYDRALLSLSRGGSDASVVREFDVVQKAFVPDGFKLPEAKSDVAWRNRDTIYVGTDFGPGSLTKSGYPRLVKEWKRGTPLSDATLIREGKEDDVSISARTVREQGTTHEFIVRSPTFFTDETFIRRGDDWVRIDKPDDAEAGVFGDYLLLRLRSDWTVSNRTHTAGSLLASRLDDWLKGGRDLAVLFEPSARTSLADYSSTANYLLLNIMTNVNSRPVLLQQIDGEWKAKALEVPEFGTANASGIDPNESDDYFLTVANFLTPSSLSLGNPARSERETLKSLPEFFNTNGLEIQQFEATSRDGTRVPYFQVSKKGLTLDGKNPTLLYGYGGFEISLRPDYNAGVGAAWLERGGVYAVANIRGGGEFGPAWHNAARKEHRQRAYDDFIAVAEDLIRRKVAAPRHLGIQGGSNGGLLMGVMLTERPNLFGAIVSQVPLLDMRRYNKLLAGASWMDEYGNPDKPDEWAYIGKYSPYQNVWVDRKYPRVLFTTSTRDDRVHPGHSRKMVALMKEQGHDVLYYENIEGGHGGAANNEQRAYMQALAFTFLWQELNP